MNVTEAIRARRMHREFRDEPVSEEALAALAEAAASAPMAGNVPVRRLLVVTDPARLATLRQVTPGLSAVSPALIAICTDVAEAGRRTGRHGREISSYIDVGAAAENVALTALELGLGVSFARSCTEAGQRVALGLPDHVRPDLLIAVGHPVAQPARAARRPRAAVFRDRWGRPWEAAA